MSSTPKLRFKDENGENYPDWEDKKLGDLISHKGGSPLEKYVSDKSSYKFISIGNYSEDGKYIDNNQRILLNDTTKEKLLNKGDLVMVLNDKTSSGNIIGATLLIPEDNKYIYNQRSERIICGDNINPKYAWFYLNSEKHRKKVFSLSQGGTQIYINFSSVKNINIKLPSLPEQEKISSFLSLFDKKIELQEKKVESLKKYKKGMMQKIFSQELRFKDENGKNYPEWEEKKLGDIGFFKTSSVDKLTRENEEIVNLVNYMDVYKHASINSNNTKYLMQVSAKDNQIRDNNLLKGDILFTPSSETPDDIGHSIVIFEDLPNTLYSYHLVRFRPSKKLDLKYSHYFCNTFNVRSQIIKFATGATRYTVGIKEFGQIIVPIPSLPEQEKIASLLSTIDKKIELEEKKLEELKEYKKGLLQQMFI